MMALMLGEKKSRQSWKLYQKWGVVEALLGSGMGVTQYCEHRKASGCRRRSLGPGG